MLRRVVAAAPGGHRKPGLPVRVIGEPHTRPTNQTWPGWADTLLYLTIVQLTIKLKYHFQSRQPDWPAAHRPPSRPTTCSSGAAGPAGRLGRRTQNWVNIIADKRQDWEIPGSRAGPSYSRLLHTPPGTADSKLPPGVGSSSFCGQTLLCFHSRLRGNYRNPFSL